MRNDELRSDMGDIANQLQSDREAVLLLYLAGELSAQDRAEMERILTQDQSLRQELEHLQALNSEVAGGLEALDSAAPLHMSTELSTRRVMREVRRFQLELKSRAPALLEASSLRQWPRWIYPVAAAAAIIFTVLGLWGVGVIDFQPTLAEQDRSRMPHYEQDEFPMYRDQVVQDRLQRILLASFGAGIEEVDHPAELEDIEDPASSETNG
jgi:anti-sigma factor RsiW